MQHIKMVKDRMGSPDGFTVMKYDKGETYEVSDSLAASFITDKDAEKAEAPKAKSEGDAPKNKAVPAAADNKAAK